MGETGNKYVHGYHGNLPFPFHNISRANEVLLVYRSEASMMLRELSLLRSKEARQTKLLLYDI